MADVLIVEDDELIASSLVRALGTIGHHGLVEGTVAGGRSRLDDVQLVLCDLGLPDGDGLGLVAEIARRRPPVPVIVLTARAEEADVVAGLGSGAVDYVTKPFSVAELLARVSTQLRHASAVAAPPRAAPLVVGSLEVDRAARVATVQGRPLALRPRELDLLARLALTPGEAVARDVLMHDVWGADWVGSSKTLDVHVNALRRRLADAGAGPERLATVRGFGYRLEVG